MGFLSTPQQGQARTEHRRGVFDLELLAHQVPQDHPVPTELAQALADAEPGRLRGALGHGDGCDRRLLAETGCSGNALLRPSVATGRSGPEQPL